VASVLGFITSEPDNKLGDYHHWATLILNANLIHYDILFCNVSSVCIHSCSSSCLQSENIQATLIIVCILLGISPASDYDLPMFRNPLSVPSSKAGCRVLSGW
jgi:hypothetical protein